MFFAMIGFYKLVFNKGKIHKNFYFDVLLIKLFALSKNFKAFYIFQNLKIRIYNLVFYSVKLLFFLDLINSIKIYCANS